MKKKRMLRLIGCLFIVITTLGLLFYRPYIHAHQYFDFYIADTCKELFGLPAIALLYLSFSKNDKPISVILTGAIVFIVWIITDFLAGGIFDYKAIIGTAIGSILTWIIYKSV